MVARAKIENKKKQQVLDNLLFNLNFYLGITKQNWGCIAAS